MAGSREAREISSKAWEWFKDAEAAYRRADAGSEQELQAIQAMSLASIAGMMADQQESWR